MKFKELLRGAQATVEKILAVIKRKRKLSVPLMKR